MYTNSITSGASTPESFTTNRPDIRTASDAELESLLSNLKQPKFRLKQIKEWIWKPEVASFEDMSNLPKALREALSQAYSFISVHEKARQYSIDGTRKYLVEMNDGVCAECVGMPSLNGRLSVCVSTQAGCAMGCAFCATGAAGLTRSLSALEIYDQVAFVEHDFGQQVTSVVLMGQGEPFMNYDASLEALRMMNDPSKLGIGARHLTVSTCGVIPMIHRFANEPEQFTLAVSLHSANQQTRNLLMPGVKKYSLIHLYDALREYTEKTGRRPSYEYVLIKGINDTTSQLNDLIAFCRSTLCHVNLIMLNDIAGSPFQPVEMARALEFKNALEAVGVETTIRESRGADIDAACGQLSQKHRS